MCLLRIFYVPFCVHFFSLMCSVLIFLFYAVTWFGYRLSNSSDSKWTATSASSVVAVVTTTTLHARSKANNKSFSKLELGVTTTILQLKSQKLSPCQNLSEIESNLLSWVPCISAPKSCCQWLDKSPEATPKYASSEEKKNKKENITVTAKKKKKKKITYDYWSLARVHHLQKQIHVYKIFRQY